MTRRCDCGSTQFRQMKHYSKEIIHSTSTGHQAEGSLEVMDEESWSCVKCGKDFEELSDVRVGEDCLHEKLVVEYKIEAAMSMENVFTLPFSQGTKELEWSAGSLSWTLEEIWSDDGETCVMKIVCKDCAAVVYDKETGFMDSQAWFDVEDLVHELEHSEFWEIPTVKTGSRMLYDRRKG